MLPTYTQLHPVTHFILAVEKACEARDKWKKLIDRDPANRSLDYGTTEFWDAVEEVKNYVHHINSTFSILPKQLTHALNNLANSWLQYDQATTEEPLPVPQTMLNDLHVIDDWVRQLPNLYTEPVIIESPKQLARQGEAISSIAVAWQCRHANGELNLSAVEQEVENPGSVEHFKIHPEQIKRNQRRRDWLATWKPIEEELNSLRNTTVAGGVVESIESLFEQGITAADAAQILGIDIQTAQLAYFGIEAKNRQEPPQPARRPQPKKPTPKKGTAKKPAARAAEKTETDNWDRFDDDDLRKMAIDTGLTVSEPFDRETVVAQLEALHS